MMGQVGTGLAVAVGATGTRGVAKTGVDGTPIVGVGRGRTDGGTLSGERVRSGEVNTGDWRWSVLGVGDAVGELIASGRISADRAASQSAVSAAARSNTARSAFGFIGIALSPLEPQPFAHSAL
jgi:hypothetical protein